MTQKFNFFEKLNFWGLLAKFIWTGVPEVACQAQADEDLAHFVGLRPSWRFLQATAVPGGW
jgi:hypothetical protein